MAQKVIHSEEVAPGEHKEMFKFLIKESGFFKTRFYFFHKHVETGERPQFGVRYFERQYLPQLLEFFEKEDFEGILSLPVGEYGKCATQFITRYVNSGKVVGFQLEQSTSQATDYLTPSKVFLDATPQLVEIAQRVDQEMD
ncbi:hypothetical protein [Reichenbachiella versicolor]|uniref:hypothetical protein n=1 Tax=Reichenbachiella versicolor TaxID=1821036 RepID=UPI000D6E263A|nr:hypothetical protein [Reichenbachiella versicolor]